MVSDSHPIQFCECSPVMLKLLERVNPGSFRDDWGSLTVHPNKMSVQCVFFEKLGIRWFSDLGTFVSAKIQLVETFHLSCFQQSPPLAGSLKNKRERGKGIFGVPQKMAKAMGRLSYAPKCLPNFEAYAGPSQSNQTRSNSIFSRLV